MLAVVKLRRRFCFIIAMGRGATKLGGDFDHNHDEDDYWEIKFRGHLFCTICTMYMGAF